jgi:hypothetical protein
VDYLLYLKGTAAAKAAALAEIAIGSAIGFKWFRYSTKICKGTGPAAAFVLPIFMLHRLQQFWCR